MAHTRGLWLQPDDALDSVRIFDRWLGGQVQWETRVAGCPTAMPEPPAVLTLLHSTGWCLRGMTLFRGVSIWVEAHPLRTSVGGRPGGSCVSPTGDTW